MTPYTEENLAGLKKRALADRIRRQIDCWPDGSFNESKTTIRQMRAALLNPEHGFSSIDPIMEGSPLTPLPASPSASTVALSQYQPDIINTAAQSNNHFGSNLEDTKELSSVSLFLQDRRFDPAKKSVVRLHIEVNTGEDGVQQVTAREVIRQLQCSYSALNGPTKLGTPHHEDPSYIEFFVQSTDDNNLEDCTFTLESLLVVSSKLDIIAENVAEPVAWKPLGGSAASIPAILPTSASSSDVASHAEPAPTDATPSKSDSLVAWLRQKVLADPGYSHFIGSYHHVVQNPDIVTIWKFASDFHKIYYNAKNPVSQTRVKKKMLFTALGVHETWFNDALTGNRLADIYGSGGPLESATVVTELAAIRRPPRGRTALLKFLQDWEADHPSISS